MTACDRHRSTCGALGMVRQDAFRPAPSENRNSALRAHRACERRSSHGRPPRDPSDNGPRPKTKRRLSISFSYTPFCRVRSSRMIFLCTGSTSLLGRLYFCIFCISINLSLGISIFLAGARFTFLSLRGTGSNRALTLLYTIQAGYRAPL